MAERSELRLRDYRPRAAVRRPLSTLRPDPPVPIVDAHAHLGRGDAGDWRSPDVGVLKATMDALGVATIVNLDGMWGDELEENLDRYDRAHPGRFVTFARWDGSMFATGDWEGLGRQVGAAFDRGARGLKVWKDLGLHLRDDRGALVMPDDPRLDPVWDEVASAGVPVTIHVGDPVAFFDPLDERNERLEELLVNPDWWFGDADRFPRLEAILDALEALIARRRDVTFVGAHVLCFAEDLAWVGRILDAYPNARADVAARLAELGRVPRAAAELVRRHPDRFLFGTDSIPFDGDVYEVHRRFFETADEHFPYDADPDEVPTQGRWAISGLELPDEVLTRVYAENARELLGIGG
jgi:predicted TIM-barrel fold metal-dependent hydrolase